MVIPSQKQKQVDRDELARLINQFGDGCFEIFVSEESLTQYCIQTVNSRIVGCIKVQPTNWYQADISHLVVHPDFRRNTIGRSLLEEACDRARFADCRIVQTTVAGNNRASGQLFHSLGFKRGEQFLGLSERTLFVWSKVL